MRKIGSIQIKNLTKFIDYGNWCILFGRTGADKKKQQKVKNVANYTDYNMSNNHACKKWV